MEGGPTAGHALRRQGTQVVLVGNLVGRETAARQVLLLESRVRSLGKHPLQQAAHLHLVRQYGEQASALHIPCALYLRRHQAVGTQPVRHGDAQVGRFIRFQRATEGIIEAIGTQGKAASGRSRRTGGRVILRRRRIRQRVHVCSQGRHIDTLSPTQADGPAIGGNAGDDVLARERPGGDIAVLHPVQIRIGLGCQQYGGSQQVAAGAEVEEASLGQRKNHHREVAEISVGSRGVHAQCRAELSVEVIGMNGALSVGALLLQQTQRPLAEQP